MMKKKREEEKKKKKRKKFVCAFCRCGKMGRHVNTSFFRTSVDIYLGGLCMFVFVM